MTYADALDYVKRSEQEPDTYAEAAEIFAALYGRQPDDDDGDAGQVWSLCCAYPDDAEKK